MGRKRGLNSRDINIDLLLLNIKEKFKLSDKEIEELSVKRDIKIPIEIFTKNIGMLESIALDKTALNSDISSKLQPEISL